MGLPHVKMMFNIVPEQMEIEGLSNVLLSVVYDNNLKPDDFECVFCNTKSTQKPQVIHQNIQELQEDGFSLCLNNRKGIFYYIFISRNAKIHIQPDVQ